MKDTIPENDEIMDGKQEDKSLSINGIRGVRGEAPLIKQEIKQVEIDWNGYPDGPRPSPPFWIIEAKEYEQNRALANEFNNQLHREDPSLDGLEIHEVKPIKFGGSPIDITNKIILTPEEHMKYTRFWNKELRRLENH